MNLCMYFEGMDLKECRPGFSKLYLFYANIIIKMRDSILIIIELIKSIAVSNVFFHF